MESELGKSELNAQREYMEKLFSAGGLEKFIKSVMLRVTETSSVPLDADSIKK